MIKRGEFFAFSESLMPVTCLQKQKRKDRVGYVNADTRLPIFPFFKSFNSSVLFLFHYLLRPFQCEVDVAAYILLSYRVVEASLFEGGVYAWVDSR